MSKHESYVKYFLVDFCICWSDIIEQERQQGVAQLVARTAGGREVAGSSPVTLTKQLSPHGLNLIASL